MKKYLVIMQQAPYANSQSLEALELALALAAFAQPVTLLFMGAGVLQLLTAQKSDLIFHKTFTQAYTGLNLFEITAVYMEQQALQKYQLTATDLSISPEPLAADQIAALIAKHDIVLSF